MDSSSTPVGLYRPEFEHDACGVAFVVDMHGRRSHEIVRMGLDSLCHLEHRGASGAEVNTGDGAGILIQIPDRFYRAVAGVRRCRGRGPTPPASASCRPTRPRPARPGTGSRSWPPTEELVVLGWREVPIDPSLGRQHRPQRHARFHQVFVGQPGRPSPASTWSGGPSSCASGLSTS